MRPKSSKKPKRTKAAKKAPVGRPTQLFKINASPEKVAQAVLQGGAPKRPETRKSG